MVRSRSIPRLAFGVPALLLATSLVVAAPARAQDDADVNPAHIHVGTCAELGDVVIPLTDVAAEEGEQRGPASGLPVKISYTSVDVPLEEIIDGGHAINVHLSADEIGTYIACGDIGGVVHERENGEGIELDIALAEIDGSGYVGVAWLGDNDEGGTNVAISLIEPEAMAGGADPDAGEAASPAAEDDATTAGGGETAATIADFAFSPDPLEVAVGSSITWTNDDPVPHTVTGRGNQDLLQSGTIAGGGTYSQTFDEAGTYEYYCEFHAGMTGSIVVE